LIEIVVIAVCGRVAKCDGWEEIAEYGERKEGFLRGFLELPNGIPWHDTFNRVFAVLDPKVWQRCFMKWLQSMSQLRADKLVSIDGKTLRVSKQSGPGKVEKAQAALEIVRAWLSENELGLAQLAVPEGRNEIAVIPELLELFDLQGATVTVEAIGCQREIATTIIEQGGEYLLSLKKNQKTLLNAVKDLFEDKLAHQEMLDSADTFDVAHGRQETPKCYVLEAVEKGCWTLEFALEVAMKRYPSDLKDKEWNSLEFLMPQRSGQGRPREYSWRELVNAMFYITRSGCSWRMLPKDLPYWVTVYHYFRKVVAH
jgi:predicted transposase YbfD/YdcC